MCLMLKCMQTSKVQIQINNQIWSSCFWRFAILVMLIIVGHLVIHLDMVAELVRTEVHKIREIIRSTTKTTITSSSKREKEVQMGLPSQRRSRCQHVCSWSSGTPCSQPTSLDGVKPSFLEWSEEVIAYLAVTDYQEFIPLLSAAAASKDVIGKDVMFKGTLSENMENIDKVTAQRLKKEQDKVKAQTENEPQEVQDLTKEIKETQGEIVDLKAKLEQKKSTLLTADFFLRCTLLHATSGNPDVMVRRIVRTSDSDSGAVTGLEIWRQMSIYFAGAKTRTASLLKQIMSPVEWNAEKSKDVIQQCYHWLELISKYEAVSSEKISDSVKITLALQMSKGTLLSLSTSASAIPQRGLRFMHFWSTTSTMQFLLTSSPPISSIRRRRPRSIPSRKAKAKVKNQKGKKVKGQERQRKISLLNLWKIRTHLKSVLVE